MELKNNYKITTLIFFFTFCFTFSKGQNQLLSKNEMKKDIAELFEKLNNIHPNLYGNSNKESINLKKDSIINSLPKTLLSTEFSRLIAPLIVSLNDGHTRVEYPKNFFKKLYKKGIKLFPIKVTIDKERRIFCVGNYNNIKDGDEILEINGIESKKIVKTLESYTAGKRLDYKRYCLSKDFNKSIYFVYNFDNKSVIKTNAGFKGSLHDIEYKDKDSDHYEPDFNYQIFDTVAYLRVGIFMFPKKFYSVVDNCFEEIKNRNIKKLIIDLRDNPGGNSMFANSLTDYILNDTLDLDKTVKRTITKASKESRRFYYGYCLKHPYLIPLLPFIPGMWSKSGTLIEQKGSGYEYPNFNDMNHFEGKVILLTSGCNYSAADDFIRNIKYYKLATIIGEETGGARDSYGDIVYFKLKKSKIKIACSQRIYYGHYLNDMPLSGVKPDISISWNNYTKKIDSLFINKIINLSKHKSLL